jgi:hypothetical protein
MPDLDAVWKAVLPRAKQGVTGMGVWAALNACQPLAFEDGTFVLGVPYEDSDLSGHLRVPHTKRLLDKLLSEELGTQAVVRVIEGTSLEEWDTAKRRDQEAERLKARAAEKELAQAEARTSWDSLYEQLGRMFAAYANKSLPQTRAKYLSQTVTLLADARKRHGVIDELSERNFARCLERVAQYSELPSTLIAAMVLEAAGEA